MKKDTDRMKRGDRFSHVNQAKSVPAAGAGSPRETVSVSICGFTEVRAYAVNGQIALTLGGFPANLTAYLSSESAALLAHLLMLACEDHHKQCQFQEGGS